MNRLILLLWATCMHIIAYGQGLYEGGGKPALDTSVFDRWQVLSSPSISNNGQWVIYKIWNKPKGSTSLVIQSTCADRKREWRDISTGNFTAQSDQFVFCFKGKDSIWIYTMSDDSLTYIPGASNFQLIEAGSDEFLLYRVGKVLWLRNLRLKEARSFDGVSEYVCSGDGKAILLKGDSTVEWIDLPDFSQKIIYHGTGAGYFVFDRVNQQVCFLVKASEGGPISHSLWLYQAGQNFAERVVDDQQLQLENEYDVGQPIQFSKNGRDILFNLETKTTQPNTIEDMPRLRLWSYNDSVLKSEQMAGGPSIKRKFAAVLHIQAGKVVRLEYENDRIKISNEQDGDYLPLLHSTGSRREFYWNAKFQESLFLVSVRDGKRIKINENPECKRILFYDLAPNGDYFIYYDAWARDYFSYDIRTGECRNITKGIKAIWSTENDEPSSVLISVGIAGYMDRGHAVLIYSQRDIYQVSLDGTYPPINLTGKGNGNGNIIFRFAMFYTNGKDFKIGEEIILNAFDKFSKDNGFYSVTLGKPGSLRKLIMQPYVIGGGGIDGLDTYPIWKAKDTSLYLVQRMNVRESSNLFLTKDFKTYQSISDVHNERAYNWMTSQLIRWKTPDGHFTQGILYKPENFNPHRKYPVLFYYYERFSDGLNAYIPPEWSEGPINIPYYVSNGYLVFVPDIYYRIGYPGKSACNAIVSAALYLSRFPWVDAKHMGIQGHSFGGYETDYVVAHTHIFIAACSASGWADYVAGYGEIHSGESRQPAYEFGRERIGVSLWERPDLYIQNSPIFLADRIATPLLMMNNPSDNQVPFTQGEELFTALRRLGKKAWMLEYEDGDHNVFDKNAVDFTIRTKEFFDYYLKEAPAPSWMLNGIGPTDNWSKSLELARPDLNLHPGLLKVETQRKLD
jgi:hypothetical protein